MRVKNGFKQSSGSVTCFIEHANSKLHLEELKKKNASNPNCLVSYFCKSGPEWFVDDKKFKLFNFNILNDFT